MDSFIKVSGDNLYLNLKKESSQVSDIVDFEKFKELIESKNLSIGIVGLGYSGLQLAVAFAGAGYSVTGIDFDRKKTKKLNSGESCIENVSDEELKKVIGTDKFFAVYDLNVIPEQDIIIICDQIPTRYPKNKDISFLMAVIENIIGGMKKTQLIILDTVTVPGTCSEVIFPLFEEQNRRINRDYYLAVAPERIEPGNKNIKLPLIPKIVAGITQESKILAQCLFSQIIKQVLDVSSPSTAEMSKYLENSHRWVNLALVNQFMIMCANLGINIWEVIKAVKSNPFEYFRFMPNPGYGSFSEYNVEPFSLIWKKDFTDFKNDILSHSIEINTVITREYIINRIIDILNSKKKCVNGANILIVGIANKRDLREWSESQSIDIINILLDKSANIYYHDPFVPSIELENKGFSLSCVELTPDMLGWMDLAVILMDHQNINFELIVKHAPLIFDAKNVTEKVNLEKQNVILI